MTSHWNVQLEIQEVREPEPLLDKNGYAVKNGIGTVQLTERTTIERVRVVVRADSETEALGKAQRLLETEMADMVQTYEVQTESGATASFTPRG
jgi:hypothetical protein